MTTAIDIVCSFGGQVGAVPFSCFGTECVRRERDTGKEGRYCETFKEENFSINNFCGENLLIACSTAIIKWVYTPKKISLKMAQKQ